MKIRRYLISILTILLFSCDDAQQVNDSASIEVQSATKSEEEVISSLFTYKGSELISTTLSKVVIISNSNTFIQIECNLEVNNNTGRILQVASNFNSAYDRFELVVTDSNNRLVTQLPYSLHQSPSSYEPRYFPIQEGFNSTSLRFSIRRDEHPENIRVRLVGLLPGSGYGRILSTNTLDVFTANTKNAEQAAPSNP